ncbi:MAG: hypothetical protein P9L94_17175 [Candidatus Hinthialibacter antarcticus]|nr:hypothetical protein [Candidatus Hinthialibacter antarcticus]
MQKPVSLRIILIVLLGLLAVVLFRAAWLCDDAFITFRVIDNWSDGFGLRWNIVERVQVFTHPLWMLLMAALHLLTGEFYYTSLVLSMALTVAAAAIFIFKIAENESAALLGGLCFVLSKAFVEYGTSGLENPLSYVLLALLYWRYLAGVETMRERFTFSLLTSLIVLNRMDAVLLCLPAFAHILYRRLTVRDVSVLLLGWLPFALWELFSLVYYGFLLPNTAYAKLFHGLSQSHLLRNSLYYFSNSLQQDPITLCVIAFALLFACALKDVRRRMVAVGVLLYVLYLVKIGGDFMSGRLLTLPFFGALVVLSGVRLRWKSWQFLTGVLLIMALGWAAPRPIALSGADYGLTEARRDAHDIADERAEYYPKTGLLKFFGQRFSAGWILRYLQGTRAIEGDVITQGNMGFMGFFGGPELHFIDVFALTDPLLARLPARQDCAQRPGHFFRVLPVGYVETVRSGELSFRDENLARFYHQLTKVAQAPLFSFERWAAIVQMNLGVNAKWVDRDYYMSKPQSVFLLDELTRRVPDGADWGHEDTHIFTTERMTIQLGSPQFFPRFEISLDSSDLYAIQYWLNGALLAEASVSEPVSVASGMASRTIKTPGPALESGFDELRVIPLDGDGNYSMGHLIPINE